MRLFRISKCNASGVEGTEFEVEMSATEDEIAAAAADAVAERLSYGWEEVADEETEQA